MKKSMIVALLSVVLSRYARAASTDTVSIIANQDDRVPVEQKVVQLKMTVADRQEENSTRRKKSQILPFGYATCSGEFIDTVGDILTAKHCTDISRDIEVVTNDGQHYQATFIATSAAHDLALIHIDRIGTPYFKLASEVVRGEQIFVLGSPLSIIDTLSTGVVAKLDGDHMLIDCGALPGNSGGPVFDSNGELVGVVTAGYIVGLGVTHLNIAQSLHAVWFFLTSIDRELFGRSR